MDGTTDALLFYCRAGFEPELAAELIAHCARDGLHGHARTERGSAHVVFVPDAGGDIGAFSRALPWRALIFARQKLRVLADLRELDPPDRISPILHALAVSMTNYGELLVEHPDSDFAKPLAGLARAFANALRPLLRRAGRLSVQDNPSLPRLHVCFVAGNRVLLAESDPADSAPWPLGIPRLRMHSDAPSRSALKLEEALLTLLDDRQRTQLMRAGMRAADLGAAPGGWTWVLTRQGLHVMAIDNGPLQPQLLGNGLVEHLRADGFQWQPSQTLDWMVCDMVEQPRRVAERMATWFREGWCRHAIFNLKLPMKRRWDETVLCLDLFDAQAQRPLRVRARQLYHDREKSTVFASRDY